MTPPTPTPSNEQAGFSRLSNLWDLLDSPLRPSPQDIALVGQRLAQWRHERRRDDLLQAVLLGVTPELATAPWAEQLDLTALDISASMIRQVWPGDTPRRRAKLCDWLQAELPPQSVDLVLGDGVFTLMHYPSGYEALAQALAQLVRPGGLVLLRCFCRPAVVETEDDVYRDLDRGAIASIEVFRWRLAMSLQGERVRQGVELKDIWASFARRFAPPASLFAATAWDPRRLALLEQYRDKTDRYHFASPQELIDGMAPWFDAWSHDQGNYALAERCPTLGFLRRA